MQIDFLILKIDFVILENEFVILEKEFAILKKWGVIFINIRNANIKNCIYWY